MGQVNSREMFKNTVKTLVLDKIHCILVYVYQHQVSKYNIVAIEWPTSAMAYSMICLYQ